MTDQEIELELKMLEWLNDPKNGHTQESIYRDIKSLFDYEKGVKEFYMKNHPSSMTDEYYRLEAGEYAAYVCLEQPHEWEFHPFFVRESLLRWIAALKRYHKELHGV